MRPWRRTYGTRRWMSGEKSYRQGRQRGGEGRGWAGEKRDKPRPTHPDFLETENWIVACGSRPISTRECTESLIHVTDVRIVDPAFSYSSLLISATVSRPLLTSQVGLHPTEKEQRELLHRKVEINCLSEGNQIPRNTVPNDWAHRKSVKGAYLGSTVGNR